LFSTCDGDFVNHIRRGDACRDAADWVGGESNYWSALSLYPMHAGYLVQYAHCLKEQLKTIDAEVYYRSALALGDTGADLLRHIAYVASKRSAAVSDSTIESIGAFWQSGESEVDTLAIPPTVADVKDCLAVFLNRGPLDIREIANLMDASPTVADVIASLMQSPDFPAPNREMLAFLVETGWSAP
jgi:hypothetical protein